MLLRDIPLSESSVNGIAQGWLSRSVLDLPLDEPIRAAHRYVKLTARRRQSRLRQMASPGRSRRGGSGTSAALEPNHSIVGIWSNPTVPVKAKRRSRR